MINIVLGLGFGDEGKGRVVDHLCQEEPNALVVRFNGGPQASHTVYKNGIAHRFSSFGSGTLNGNPTYWSSFCPFHPVYFLNELKALLKLGVTPTHSIAWDAPLITPYDVAYNRALEATRGDKHGSCGIGIGATIERHERGYKLYVGDLMYPTLLMEKLKQIEKYYNENTSGQLHKQYLSVQATIEQLSYYLRGCSEALEHTLVVNEKEFLRNFEGSVIFEGAQGILLDMDHGIFPHVTRSNTTCKNAYSLIRSCGMGLTPPIINYVTRTYLTRHGEGPMMSDILVTDILHNLESETNTTNEWQGDFRRAPLNLDLIDYARACNELYSHANPSTRLFVTCVDQLRARTIPCTIEGKPSTTTTREIAAIVGAKECLESHSHHSEERMKSAPLQ